MTQQDTSRIIFTSDPDSAEIALSELRKADKAAALEQWLAPGVGLLATDMEWRTFAGKVHNRAPIFCRHICPAQAVVPLDRTPDDLDRMATAAAGLMPGLRPSMTASVQTRLLGDGWTYGNFDVNGRLASVLEGVGATIDVRKPLQVLSVVCTPEHAYIGLSWANENLSDWAGGARRFKREEGRISRAEFKLLEALDVFDIQLPEGGSALDLGAAPGGWTRILRSHGMRVVAVDPAELHPSVGRDPQVVYRRQTAQAYFPTQDRFDVIVNDMRMDARDSARIMLTAAYAMKPNGIALMTLKLPTERTTEVLAMALEILRKRYEVVGARQLFHNRSEVTAALRLRT